MSVPHSADSPPGTTRTSHALNRRLVSDLPTVFWEVALCATQLRRSRSEDAEHPADALSDRQYHELVTVGGIGGSREAAEVIDAGARILTDTTVRHSLVPPPSRPDPPVRCPSPTMPPVSGDSGSPDTSTHHMPVSLCRSKLP